MSTCTKPKSNFRSTLKFSHLPFYFREALIKSFENKQDAASDLVVGGVCKGGFCAKDEYKKTPFCSCVNSPDEYPTCTTASCVNNQFAYRPVALKNKNCPTALFICNNINEDSGGNVTNLYQQLHCGDKIITNVANTGTSADKAKIAEYHENSIILTSFKNPLLWVFLVVVVGFWFLLPGPKLAVPLTLDI